jgi:hypothetical protein
MKRSLTSIDDWISSLALAPHLELAIIVTVAEVFSKGNEGMVLADPREGERNIPVEIL